MIRSGDSGRLCRVTRYGSCTHQIDVGDVQEAGSICVDQLRIYLLLGSRAIAP